MTNRFLIIIAFCACILTIQAQSTDKANEPRKAPSEQHKDGFKRHKKFNPEQYTKQKIAYVIKNVQLNQQEIDEVLPLIKEMREKQRKNDEVIRSLRFKSKENPGESECAEIINKILSLKEANIKLEQEYLKKILKKTSAQKYLKIAIAQEKFDHDMLRKMMNQNSNSKRNPQNK